MVLVSFGRRGSLRVYGLGFIVLFFFFGEGGGGWLRVAWFPKGPRTQIIGI